MPYFCVVCGQSTDYPHVHPLVPEGWYPPSYKKETYEEGRIITLAGTVMIVTSPRTAREFSLYYCLHKLFPI